ncbi:AAA family ATPase [Hoeflea poritis]|uniref:AAA family ATPase n=1 Tax=Hoeflea poritis TaxID=2993659 RepID=A0ABT4VKN1_9HYPH|nr:AAA family ATPase [Hoeflea poritis]MDA4845249.1 AAA family ATPase [Hoeflea poritis]
MERNWNKLDRFAIGVSGKIGSGKTTFIRRLCEEHDFAVASFGTFFRKLAEDRNLPSNREVFQNITDEYFSKHNHIDLVTEVINKSGWNKENKLLLDGMRYAETIPAVSNIIHPVPLFLVYINVSENERIKRIEKRDNLRPNILKQHETHESESAVYKQIISAADLIIGDTDLNDAVAKLYNFIAKQQ